MVKDSAQHAWCQRSPPSYRASSHWPESRRALGSSLRSLDDALSILNEKLRAAG